MYEALAKSRITAKTAWKLSAYTALDWKQRRKQISLESKESCRTDSSSAKQTGGTFKFQADVELRKANHPQWDGLSDKFCATSLDIWLL